MSAQANPPGGERWVETQLRYYRNVETGLVRSFLFKPRRGKWELTTLRYATPMGRAAILRATARTGDTDAE